MASPTKRLKLSLEPPPNPYGSSSNAIASYDIDEEGNDVFEDDETIPGQLTKNIRKLWAQKTPFRELSVEKLREEGFDDDAAGQEDSDTFTVEQMHEAKDKMIEKLRWAEHVLHDVINSYRDARNEFAYALDLVNVLLTASRPTLPLTQQLPLPAGAITTTYLSKSKMPVKDRLQQMRISVAQKKESLTAASELLLSSASRLTVTTAKEDQFWTEALELRKSGWNATSRRSRAQIGQRSLLLLYAYDGAPQETRRNAVIDLRKVITDIEERAEDEINDNRKPVQYFRVCLAHGQGSNENLLGCSRLPSLEAEAHTVQARLAKLQRQSFELELLSEIAKGTRDLSSLDVDSSEHKVKIAIGGSVHLVCEMVTREDHGLESSERGPQDVVCELIKAALTLRLCAEHRTRRDTQDVQDRRGSIQDSGRKTMQTSILQLPLDLLRYESMLKRLERILRHKTQILTSIGVDVDISITPCLNTLTEVLGMLYLDEKSESLHTATIGGSCLVRVTASTPNGTIVKQLMHFALKSPSSMTLSVQNVSVGVSMIGDDDHELESSELAQIVERELCQHFLLRVIKTAGNTEDSKLEWRVDETDAAAVGRSKVGGGVLGKRIQVVISDAEQANGHAKGDAMDIDGPNEKIIFKLKSTFDNEYVPEKSPGRRVESKQIIVQNNSDGLAKAVNEVLM